MKIPIRIMAMSLVLTVILSGGSFGEVRFDGTPVTHPILHTFTAPSRGLLVAIVGEAGILRTGEEQYIQAIGDEYVGFDDVLQLQPNASIVLVFEDNSSINVGPVKTTTWFMLKPLQK